MSRRLLSLIGLLVLACIAPAQGDAPNARWSADKAKAWYEAQPWLVGCNFIRSSAVNQLEMWQADSFDPATIDRELKWAAGIGMNTVRVFLHDLVYDADPKAFKERLRKYVEIADSHKIRTMFVFFDDV